LDTRRAGVGVLKEKEDARWEENHHGRPLLFLPLSDGRKARNGQERNAKEKNLFGAARGGKYERKAKRQQARGRRSGAETDRHTFRCERAYPQ
jgi:hypothetical protein